MRLGMMNDPRQDACAEAAWAAAHGFDFLDLTLEGPGASLEMLDVPTLKNICTHNGLELVGHTAYYLPFSSPVARLRRAAIESVADTFAVFAELGVRWVNVHLTATPRLFSRRQRLTWNAESFAELAERAAAYNLRIMVEHPPEAGLTVAEIVTVLQADARLGFHLDVGHANIGSDKLADLLSALGYRLAHVHMSDNSGRTDDHTTLGAGTIDWPRAVRLLKRSGYDDTITLEVFSRDRDYLLLSAQKLRTWWQHTEV